MKKIVGIMAAVAMAASLFAVEMTGAIKVSGSVAKYDGSEVTLLGKQNVANGGLWYDSRMQVNVWGDRTEAQFRVIPGDYTWGQYKVAFKPMDMLKVNLGSELAYKINGGDWWMSVNDINWSGYAFDITPVEGLEINLALKAMRWDQTANNGAGAEVDSFWFKGDVGDTAIYIHYNLGDAGKIGAAYVYQWDQIVSVGYSNKFGDVAMFADVAATINKQAGFSALKANCFADYNADGLGVKGYACFSANSKFDTLGLDLYAKVSKALEGATVYCEVRDTNVMAKAFALNVVPGVTFNVGSTALEVKADMNIGSAFTVNVPLSATVSF